LVAERSDARLTPAGSPTAQAAPIDLATKEPAAGCAEDRAEGPISPGELIADNGSGGRAEDKAGRAIAATAVISPV
jgi:hypothetical protein